MLFAKPSYRSAATSSLEIVEETVPGEKLFVKVKKNPTEEELHFVEIEVLFFANGGCVGEASSYVNDSNMPAGSEYTVELSGYNVGAFDSYELFPKAEKD